jgi:hypothetical protein
MDHQQNCTTGLTHLALKLGIVRYKQGLLLGVDSAARVGQKTSKGGVCTTPGGLGDSVEAVGGNLVFKLFKIFSSFLFIKIRKFGQIVPLYFG